MLKEIGVVSDIQQIKGKQNIWVETQIKSTCGSCEAQSNCGTGAIAKVLAPKRERLKFPFDGQVAIGQKVTLGIPEESLLKASSLVYLVPLMVLIFSAVLAQTLLPVIGLTGELWVILISFSCAALSFKAISLFLNHSHFDDFHPKLLGISPCEAEKIDITVI